jgi:alpha-D-ribose 1-methylphosphonate 5-triphosphate synthase subunit PhnL
MLAVKKLSKEFTLYLNGEKTIQGFNDVSFKLENGECLGIAGPSGAGKSSILKCIYRTYIPTGGDIFYDSVNYGSVNLALADDFTLIKVRDEFGYITQFLHVIPRVTAKNLVAEPLIQSGIDEKSSIKLACEMLERLLIPSKLFDAYPSTFSGGEKQRINIARAIIKRPHLLLMDEPTASLDKNAAGVVLELLRELINKGTTIIGIFHDVEVMSMLVDTVYTVAQDKEIYCEQRI